jgi:hypothetical protein
MTAKRLPQPIDSTLHGVTDYSVGAVLVSVFPRLAGISGTPAGRQIRAAGAVHAGYSALTDYPLGAAKVFPYKAHLAMDAAGAIALAVTPFVTGQWKKGASQWVPHLALAAIEFGTLALTDPTGKGAYTGNVEAVRAANTENPSRKIRDGQPAVTRSAR